MSQSHLLQKEKLPMPNFKLFADAIAAQFALMSNNTLVRVAFDPDELWQTYLASFPEGTNPIYRVRTEHDGSYDRNFVRKLGNVAAIKDGVITTIWDAPNLEYPYDVVCGRLAELVKNSPIVSAFRHNESTVGYVQTTERLESGDVKVWNHFHAQITVRYFTSDVDAKLGEINTTVQMGKRALDELKPEAISTVLDLIESNSLYRGEEHRQSLTAFRDYQIGYKHLQTFNFPSNNIDRWCNIYLWENQGNMINRFRNTAIGTLVVDLSEGVDLEDAVRAFEFKVAPTNYKRTTALITPTMVKDAMKIIDTLGLEPALARRHARLQDVSVNNVLWVDTAVRDVMKDGGVAELLMAAAAPQASDKGAVDISIKEFLRDVLPKSNSLEVMVKNNQQGNLMSLVAPVNSEVPNLLKWDNNFTWTYNGNVADSIKERVKTAGGNTDAALRVSLAWFNYDDLDLHAQCPDGHVFYNAKTGHSWDVGINGQILNVDMNAHSGKTRSPVENLSWRRPMDGHYKIAVHQFAQREVANVGFTLEMECAGQGVQQYTYRPALRAGMTFEGLEFDMRNGKFENLKVNKELINESMSQVVWGVETEKFLKVNAVMLSPNYWDNNQTGNKHWFFMIDKCRNPEPTRGLYNEFLKPELEAHRKVFEVLGDKMKCPVAEDQISGLGFSSTKRDNLLARVKGPTINRTYNIQF
jgi:hypothetical protein